MNTTKAMFLDGQGNVALPFTGEGLKPMTSIVDTPT